MIYHGIVNQNHYNRLKTFVFSLQFMSYIYIIRDKPLELNSEIRKLLKLHKSGNFIFFLKKKDQADRSNRLDNRKGQILYHELNIFLIEQIKIYKNKTPHLVKKKET